MNSNSIEKKFKILTRAELNHLNRFTVERWFKECLGHMITEDEYEKAATLRDANARWQNQMLSGSTISNRKNEM